MDPLNIQSRRISRAGRAAESRWPILSGSAGKYAKGLLEKVGFWDASGIASCRVSREGALAASSPAEPR